MYFRVSVSVENENTKKVLLKALSIKNAREMADEVGKMLFPNDKCETFVREVKFKNLKGYMEKYYEFTAVKDTGSKTTSVGQCDDWYSIIKAENEDEAWEKVNEIYKDDNVSSFYIEKVDIKELLDGEIELFKKHIAMNFAMKNGATVGEYGRLMRDEEKLNEYIYEALTEKQHRERMESVIRDKIDLSKISVKEYEECVDKLSSANDEASFNAIHKEIIEKHSK